MKRCLTVVGLGLGLIVMSTGAAMADCPRDGGPYPESEGWTAVDATLTIPAGYACDAAVSARFVGHQKVTVNGKLPTGDPQPGDRIVSRSPDEVLTLTNTGTNRSITKKVDGTLYDLVLPNGTDLKTRGVGRNVYFGPGINGLLWTDGIQRLRTIDYASDSQSLEIVKIKGRAVDLCAKVGARPVPGKVPPATA